MSIESLFSKLKRKPSSTSSASECESPTIESQKEKKQERKKIRVDDSEKSEERNMSVQATLDEINKKLEFVATKDNVNQLKTEMERVVESLNKKIDKLESRLYDIEKMNDGLTNALSAEKKKNAELLCKVETNIKNNTQLFKAQNEQEQYMRRWNCRVFKVKEVEGETADQCAQKCVDVFGQKIGVKVSMADIEVAHRTGAPPTKDKPNPRPILVRFFSRQKRDLVLSQRKNLKGLGVSVGDDLTKANYILLRRAEAHSATLSAWSSRRNVLATVKNGKIVRLEVGEDTDTILSNQMK